MLLISVILSITKFPPEQRVEQDGMIQSHDRSSTSTSTKNSQNKTMHRSGRSAAINFRNHFGGHSVLVTVRREFREGRLTLGRTFRSNLLVFRLEGHEAIEPSLNHHFLLLRRGEVHRDVHLFASSGFIARPVQAHA